MCLLKMAESVCEGIFEQTKHRLVVVLASELTAISYLNVSSVIRRGKRHFYTPPHFSGEVLCYTLRCLSVRPSVLTISDR